MVMNHIFVGNPGVGKSTLLNCLLGEPKFKSGFSVGKGMTYQLDMVSYPDDEDPDRQVYLDTPGLEDEKLRKAAAEAITAALKQEGNYKVFFVVTLEVGRVRPQDKLVMEMVLECCEDITSYTVIINKLNDYPFEQLQTNKEDREKLLAMLIPKIDKRSRQPDPHIKFLRKVTKLDEGRPNEFTNIAELNDIVDYAPYMIIRKENVDALDGTGFAEKLKKQEQIINKFREREEALNKRIEEFTKQMKEMEERRAEEERMREKDETLRMEQLGKRNKMRNQLKEGGKDVVDHPVSCKVTVEHLQQSLVKETAYKKVINSSDAFESSYKKVASAISMSGSGGIPGIFELSSEMEGSFKKVVAESSRLSNYRYEEKFEEKEYNPNFLQLLRKVSTEVTINGNAVQMIETTIVDSIPNASPLTSEQREKKSEEFIRQVYGDGAGITRLSGPQCIYQYYDQLLEIVEKKVEEKKEPEAEWYYIRGVQSSLYLDHSGGGKHGNRLEIHNKSGHDCQIWKLTEDGYIQNKLGHVMDVAKFGECGGRVDGWHANNTIKQKWYKEGQYIVSQMNHKVLDVERRRTDKGAGIIIYKKNGQPNQLWKWIPAE